MTQQRRRYVIQACLLGSVLLLCLYFFDVVGWASCFFFMLLLMVVLARYVLVDRLRRHRTRKHEDGQPEQSCDNCGYNLVGVPLPRCPECGCAIGFKKTFEQLRVSREELRGDDLPRDEKASRRGGE